MDTLLYPAIFGSRNHFRDFENAAHSSHVRPILVIRNLKMTSCRAGSVPYVPDRRFQVEFPGLWLPISVVCIGHMRV